MQIVSRRLQNAGQKVSGVTAADTQGIQAAACACLSAAFGTKAAVASVASMFGTGGSQAANSGSSQVHVTLLDLSMSGDPIASTVDFASGLHHHDFIEYDDNDYELQVCWPPVGPKDYKCEWCW